MSNTNNYCISYIEAIKKTEELLPPKSKKDYHEKYYGYLVDEFVEKLKALNIGFTEEDVAKFMKDINMDFELFFINSVECDKKMLTSPLRPRSIDAQLFLSQIKFYIPNRLMGNNLGYDLLQQKGEEGNAFEKLGDLEEIREHITKANIHDYVNEVLSSALELEQLREVGNPVFAQDILLHFGLSPIYHRKNPGYVQDIINIIDNRVGEIKGTWNKRPEIQYLPEILSADEMSKLFSGVTEEITDYVWSICKGYIDEIIGKRYVLTMNEKK